MKMFIKILRISGWILLLVGIIFTFAFVQKKEDQLLCSQIKIKILMNPVQEFFFVEDEDILSLITHRCGQVVNFPLRNIDVNYIERLMYTNPWIARAEVYLNINGVLNIDIEQRNPILRVINKKGESYYIDSLGKLMVWSPKFTPRVLLATGNISEFYDGWYKINLNEIINNDTLKTLTVLDDLYAMTKFILADEFWSAQVEQIYLNEDGEIELIPKVGNHKIIFGTIDGMAEKFRKLNFFYKEGLNYTGWNDYDTLNLKFNNQVVCTKSVAKN
ncbi:MAG: hypothetical protein V1781_05665 [Bacteroidota bacterium]